MQRSQGLGGSMRRGSRYGHQDTNGLVAIVLDLDGMIVNSTVGSRRVY